MTRTTNYPTAGLSAARGIRCVDRHSSSQEPASPPKLGADEAECAVGEEATDWLAVNRDPGVAGHAAAKVRSGCFESAIDGELALGTGLGFDRCGGGHPVHSAHAGLERKGAELQPHRLPALDSL